MSTLFGVGVSSNQLYTIDPATGAGTAVGPLGFTVVDGLAFDPTTSTLFGVTSINANITPQLITIDPATGAGTAVGPLGFDTVTGLTFDPTTSTLFGVTLNFAFGTDQLITIDPAPVALSPFSYFVHTLSP